MADQDLTPWRRGGLTTFAADPFSQFRREIDRLFDDFFAPAPETRSFAAAGEAGLRPSIEVEESEQAYAVTAELPGLSENDIELSLRENALTISGEKRSGRSEEGGGRRYTERSYGRFSRTIPFPSEVDPDQIQATYRNGVLSVTLPKHPQARDQARRIEVKPQAGESSTGKASSGSGPGR